MWPSPSKRRPAMTTWWWATPATECWRFPGHVQGPDARVHDERARPARRHGARQFSRVSSHEVQFYVLVKSPFPGLTATEGPFAVVLPSSVPGRRNCRPLAASMPRRASSAPFAQGSSGVAQLVPLQESSLALGRHAAASLRRAHPQARCRAEPRHEAVAAVRCRRPRPVSLGQSLLGGGDRFALASAGNEGQPLAIPGTSLPGWEIRALRPGRVTRWAPAMRSSDSIASIRTCSGGAPTTRREPVPAPDRTRAKEARAARRRPFAELDRRPRARSRLRTSPTRSSTSCAAMIRSGKVRDGGADDGDGADSRRTIEASYRLPWLSHRSSRDVFTSARPANAAERTVDGPGLADGTGSESAGWSGAGEL